MVIKFTQIDGFQASTQFPKKIETSRILLFTAVNFGCSSNVYFKYRHVTYVQKGDSIQHIPHPRITKHHVLHGH